MGGVISKDATAKAPKINTQPQCNLTDGHIIGQMIKKQLVF